MHSRSGCRAGAPRSPAPAAARIDEHRPPTRTRSVMKNRALAAAYAGAHRFGVEVFEPATSRCSWPYCSSMTCTPAARRTPIPGGTRRALPRRAGCGVPHTPPAARSGSRQRSATAQPENDARSGNARTPQRSSHHAAWSSDLHSRPLPNPAHTTGHAPHPHACAGTRRWRRSPGSRSELADTRIRGSWS
jgi:hypothetical protein